MSSCNGKGNCHKSQIFVCGELGNFLKEIVALKNAENFCHKNSMARGWADIPGGENSFALAIWVCTSVAPKSTVFQWNLYCKTVIRFSPSFRKNIQHFPLISLLDLTLHTETNDENLKKSIRVKACRPLVQFIFEYTSEFDSKWGSPYSGTIY